mmetsp:Transcript_69092/g.167074  ORF Transcript_69092/g.167074 Transcript_69092/m.167074 type:complete len:256 (-) Transcript_69092:594-1361(-)
MVCCSPVWLSTVCRRQKPPPRLLAKASCMCRGRARTRDEGKRRPWLRQLAQNLFLKCCRPHTKSRLHCALVPSSSAPQQVSPPDSPNSPSSPPPPPPAGDSGCPSTAGGVWLPEDGCSAPPPCTPGYGGLALAAAAHAPPAESVPMPAPRQSLEAMRGWKGLHCRAGLVAPSLEPAPLLLGAPLATTTAVARGGPSLAALPTPEHAAVAMCMGAAALAPMCECEGETSGVVPPSARGAPHETTEAPYAGSICCAP